MADGVWQIDLLRIWPIAVGLAALGLWLGSYLHRQRLDRIMQEDPETISSDATLAKPTFEFGRAVFAKYCASCHGKRGEGRRDRGAPDLTDGDFLYGSGKIAEIEQIVLHGIRSGDSKGWNLASMPAYATSQPYKRESLPSLRPNQIHDIVAYLSELHGIVPNAAAAARGEQLFRETAGCYDCHTPSATGDPGIGSPNLVDDVWLYGDGSEASIYNSIAYGRAGMSPAYARVLTPIEARAVSVFVAALNKHDRDMS